MKGNKILAITTVISLFIIFPGFLGFIEAVQQLFNSHK
jgi:hypothetical protein